MLLKFQSKTVVGINPLPFTRSSAPPRVIYVFTGVNAVEISK
jgi:hypothetical protein